MVTMDLISSIENPHNTLNYCVFVLVMFDIHELILCDFVAVADALRIFVTARRDPVVY
jgi:hypothetical protein